jgi:hypothetical protein
MSVTLKCPTHGYREGFVPEGREEAVNLARGKVRCIVEGCRKKVLVQKQYKSVLVQTFDLDFEPKTAK